MPPVNITLVLINFLKLGCPLEKFTWLIKAAPKTAGTLIKMWKERLDCWHYEMEGTILDCEYFKEDQVTP